MNEIIKQPDYNMLEKVLLQGDLSKMTPMERVHHYKTVTTSLGINEWTKPFEYIMLNNKLTLYATKNCTDQLRKLNNISIEIKQAEIKDGIFIVIAKATTPDGRSDEDIGAINIAGLKGDAYTNSIMKAYTKAKRRVTLSICGLSFVDESEIETIPNTQKINIDISTGEINADKKPLLNAMKNAKQEVKITTRPYSLEQLIKFRDTDKKLWNTKLLTEKELTEINIVLNKIVNNVDAKRKALIKFFFGVDSSKDISAGGMEFLYRFSGYMNKEKKKTFDWQPSDVIIEEAQTIFEFMLENNEVDTDIDNNKLSKYEEIFGVDDDK
ncbi:hypothetical protein [Methanoculleus sp.]|uniref:hypothetical protein n=1 Tax=Methanoculleus sp. TaxID=90427 RepID=UPI0025DBF240|nr:hypothetical protein [Methanoculleus sp.]MCK9320257.1 hypothetical protein [Methanoculleus sp.]